MTLRSECHEAKETWDWERKKEEGINIFNSSSLGAPLSLNTHTHTHILVRQLTLKRQGCLLRKLQVRLILVHVG